MGVMDQLSSGEACVRDLGEISKIESHVRSSLVRGAGEHVEMSCGGSVGDGNGVLLY